MSYQLVGYPLCPFVQRVLIALNYKKVAHELTWLDPHGELPDWFNAWSPLGKVPVMKVSERDVLFESLAIVEFIEEEHPEHSLYESCPISRAKDRAWAGVAGELYGPQYMSMRTKTVEDADQYFDALKATLVILENEKNSDTRYFSRDQFSLVDLVLAPMFARFVIVDELRSGDLLSGFPKLAALRDTLLNEPFIAPMIDREWKENFIKNMAKNGGVFFN